MSEKNEQLSARVWFGLVLFIFMGSMAANLQGTLTSVFLDNTVFDQGSMGAKITLTDAVNIITSGSAVIQEITAEPEVIILTASVNVIFAPIEPWSKTVLSKNTLVSVP